MGGGGLRFDAGIKGRKFCFELTSAVPLTLPTGFESFDQPVPTALRHVSRLRRFDITPRPLVKLTLRV